MSIAAVPNYLQRADSQFYLSAPPGHRFLLYFAAWGENQETGKVDWRMADRVPHVDRRTGHQKIGNAGPQWDDLPNDQYACTVAACRMPPFDDEKPRKAKPKTDFGLQPWQPVMKSLLGRQADLASKMPGDSMLRLDALSVAPFTTGLGNEHPLENGFAFLNPYGLPYLPGSGVKGVLRQAARELAGLSDNAKWEVPSEWSADAIDALFGKEARDGTDHQRGALCFWDVIPQIRGDSLMVEIMTPHQSHYYQQNPAAGSTAPHESGSPNPISFLTVPPGSGFVFHVQCNLAHLRGLAPELAADGRWKSLLEVAFAHAFAWLGFGAKTAVGYGAMAPDPRAALERERNRQAREEALRVQAAERERLLALAALGPVERAVREFLDARPDRNQPELSALIGGMKQGRFAAADMAQVAGIIRGMMEKQKKWKEKSEKKNPDKDRDHQDTLAVLGWLRGR